MKKKNNQIRKLPVSKKNVTFMIKLLKKKKKKKMYVVSFGHFTKFYDVN